MSYSIIIATFNNSKYIKESINSVVTQIRSGDEVIIVNDKSTDDTRLIIESMKYNQIKLINLDKNIGAAGARNEGLKVANSDYIIFLDSDDIWADGIYQIIDKILKLNPSIDILMGCVEHFYSPELESEIKKLYKLPPVSKATFSSGIVTKKSLIEASGGFNQEYRERGEWIDFMSRLQMLNPNIMVLDNVFYKRRIHNTNNSHKHNNLRSYIPALRENILRKRLKN